MLLKQTKGSTSQARQESWKKRQFEAPHNGERRSDAGEAKTSAEEAADHLEKESEKKTDQPKKK
jgi:hypothetical protein